MHALRYLLLSGSISLFVGAVVVLGNDLRAEYKYRRAETSGVTECSEPEPVRWRTTIALAALAWAPMLIGLAMFILRGIPGGNQ